MWSPANVTLGVAEVEQLTTEEVAATNIASAPDPALLGCPNKLADSRQIRVSLQRVYRLEEAADGLDTLQTGHMCGKLAISLVTA